MRNKKRIGCLTAALALTFGMTMNVSAAEVQTVGLDEKLTVTFNGTEMVSNFTAEDINAQIGNVLPGGSVTIQVEVQNDSQDDTDWYMKNEVLKSFEEANAASGGAYTYELVYTPEGGSEQELYSNDALGGEQELHDSDAAGSGQEASEGEISQGLMMVNDATLGGDGYFYLDAMAPGEKGTVRLTVSLDGETLTNDYVDSQAAINLAFAVERTTQTVHDVTVREEHTVYQTGAPQVIIDDNMVPLAPKTGDENLLLPAALGAMVGVLLIAVFFGYQMKNRKEGQER